MTTDDAVKILEAVGDSWPAAVVVVSLVVGFIAVRALPRLKEIVEGLREVRHEFTNNSGKTVRDAIDRIEKRVNEQGEALDAHIVEARGRDEADLAWKAQVEDLLTQDDE
jgi:vacuolar-type H+-ATPase subunit E/Vma4